MYNEGFFRSLKLTELHYWNAKSNASEHVPYKKGDLAAAIKLCPSVVTVKIHCGFEVTFTDKELKWLLNLQNLQELSLGDNVLLSFEGGLLPILQKFGPSSLEKLELANVTDVDVGAIAQNCSKLRSLKLEKIKRYIPPGRQLKPADNRLCCFEHLEMVQFEAKESNLIIRQPAAADFSILLSCPALVNLSFFNFPGLTDLVVEKAVSANQFPNLKSFRIESCEAISKSSIDLLLTLDNPLSKIVVKRCKRFRKKPQLKKWEDQIEKNNWELRIDMD